MNEANLFLLLLQIKLLNSFLDVHLFYIQAWKIINLTSNALKDTWIEAIKNAAAILWEKGRTW